MVFFCKIGKICQGSLLQQSVSDRVLAMANNIRFLEQYGILRRNLSLEVSRRIKDLPFGPRQMVMLKVIYTTGEIALGKLAERVGTDPGTVSRSIAQMVRPTGDPGAVPGSPKQKG